MRAGDNASLEINLQHGRIILAAATAGGNEGSLQGHPPRLESQSPLLGPRKKEFPKSGEMVKFVELLYEF